MCVSEVEISKGFEFSFRSYADQYLFSMGGKMSAKVYGFDL